MIDDSSQYDAPPTPEDLALLVQMAGPIFAESKLIESYTSNSPQYDGRVDEGSMKIKRGLERIEQQVRASSRPLPQQNPNIYQYPPTQGPQYVPQPVEFQAPPKLDGQLEFNFNLTEQKKTNELLIEISRKLSKLISLIDSNITQKNGSSNTLSKNEGV